MTHSGPSLAEASGRHTPRAVSAEVRGRELLRHSGRESCPTRRLTKGLEDLSRLPAILQEIIAQTLDTCHKGLGSTPSGAARRLGPKSRVPRSRRLPAFFSVPPEGLSSSYLRAFACADPSTSPARMFPPRPPSGVRSGQPLPLPQRGLPRAPPLPGSFSRYSWTTLALI